MLKKAADQGHVDAQFRLSEVHRSQRPWQRERHMLTDIEKAYAYRRS